MSLNDPLASALSKIMNADEVTSEKLGILMGGGN